MGEPERQRFVAVIAEKYGARLKRFLRLRLSNSADVPDLAQEVFLRLLRVSNQEAIRSPEAYLFTVATHVVQQHHHRASAALSSLDWIESFCEQLAARDDPSANLETAQRIALFERQLDNMPPRMATALLMHRVAGHSVEEIAKELGVAEITVKKYLAKALLRCRAEVSHD